MFPKPSNKPPSAVDSSVHLRPRPSKEIIKANNDSTPWAPSTLDRPHSKPLSKPSSMAELLAPAPALRGPPSDPHRAKARPRTSSVSALRQPSSGSIVCLEPLPTSRHQFPSTYAAPPRMPSRPSAEAPLPPPAPATAAEGAGEAGAKSKAQRKRAMSVVSFGRHRISDPPVPVPLLISHPITQASHQTMSVRPKTSSSAQKSLTKSEESKAEEGNGGGSGPTHLSSRRSIRRDGRSLWKSFKDKSARVSLHPDHGRKMM